MKGLESYSPSWEILSLNQPSDSNFLRYAQSSLNIISDIRTAFSQFFRNPRTEKRPIFSLHAYHYFDKQSIDVL